MAPPKNNTYYLLAKNFRKPRSYKPGPLWKKAMDYFKWAHDNPLYEEKVFSNGKRMKVAKLRAMTITGFCLFACMTRDTFNRYEKDDAYSDICKQIKDIIYNQKLEGAAADLLNPAIIVRELGLADKKDITTDGESLNQGYYEHLKARRKQSGEATDQKGDTGDIPSNG